MNSSAMVSISLSEFMELQTAKQKAEQEAATLKEQIRQQRIEMSDVHALVVARAAIEVTRFAVASMPPESTKGWPTRALRDIAAHIQAMPDATHDDGDLAITLGHFANECDRYAERRRVLAHTTLDLASTD